jgi:hypothetical protein
MVSISQTKISSFSDCDQCFEGSSIPIASLVLVLLYIVNCLVLETQDYMNWKETEPNIASLLDDWRHCPRVLCKIQTSLTAMSFRIDIKLHIHLEWSVKLYQRNDLKLELTKRYWLLLMKKRSPQSPVVVLTSIKYSGVASDQIFPSRYPASMRCLVKSPSLSLYVRSDVSLRPGQGSLPKYLG